MNHEQEKLLNIDQDEKELKKTLQSKGSSIDQMIKDASAEQKENYYQLLLRLMFMDQRKQLNKALKK